MVIVAAFATGWLVGTLLTLAFIAAANRTPTPEPIRPLDTLEHLARVA